MPNMKFKPCFRSKLLQHSDVPLQAPFAHGFAIIAQTPPSVPRRLTWCYASWLLILLSLGITSCSDQRVSTEPAAEVRAIFYDESPLVFLVVQKERTLDMNDTELTQMLRILESSVEGDLQGSLKDYGYILEPLMSGGKIVRVTGTCISKVDGCSFKTVYRPDQQEFSSIKFESES